MITANGTIAPVAGTGISGFGGDGGAAAAAELNGPEAVARDASGNLFIADSGNRRVRELLAANGTIVTIAGNGSRVFSGDGGPAGVAGLGDPAGIALDLVGNLFIADSGDNRVRYVSSGGLLLSGLASPTVAVSDAGGTYNGSPFPAVATVAGSNGLAGSSLEGGSPTLTYYAGGTASGTGSATAPSAAGRYTVVASFAGSADYAAGQSAPVTFTIAKATPKVSVSDAGGTYSGAAFPATATVAGVVSGVDTTPAASLEGTGLTLAYYAGSAATGTGTATAPSSAGTYTVVASFAGSADYAAAQSGPVTFTIAAPGAAADSVGVFSGGYWYLNINGTTQVLVSPAGWAGATPVVGDWNGDGKTEIGLFLNGKWWLDTNEDGWLDSGDEQFTFGFSGPDVVPVVGDWNGAGKTEVGVYADGAWFRDIDGSHTWDATNAAALAYLGWNDGGTHTVIPVPGNWAGDGKTEMGVYCQGVWFLDSTGSNQWDGGHTYWGWAGTLTPVVGNWSGTSAKSQFGVYNQGVWFLDYDNSHLWDAANQNALVYYGWSGAVPVDGAWPASFVITAAPGSTLSLNLPGVSLDPTAATSVLLTTGSGQQTTVPATVSVASGTSTVVFTVPPYFDAATSQFTSGIELINIQQQTATGTVSVIGGNVSVQALPQTGLAPGGADQPVSHAIRRFSQYRDPEPADHRHAGRESREHVVACDAITGRSAAVRTGPDRVGAADRRPGEPVRFGPGGRRERRSHAGFPVYAGQLDCGRHSQ